MLKNYLKIAIRNLWKHKIFTLTNIIGLAVAFGATLLLSLTAFHELSFDRFHEQKNSLFQVYGEVHHPGTTENNTSFSIPFTPTLRTELPDLVHATRFGDIDISIWVFLFAAIMALLIALFTISFQALKTAWLNPVDNLKSE